MNKILNKWIFYKYDAECLTLNEGSELQQSEDWLLRNLFILKIEK